MKEKFPRRYYFYLLLVLLLSLIFWWLILNPNSKREVTVIYRDFFRPETPDEFWKQEEIPDEIAKPLPIDTSFIEYDTVSNINILSNIINIALAEKNGNIAELAYDLKTKYPDDKYRIVYIDSVINRLQFEVPEEERKKIKNEIKIKLKKYKMLIWDESIFQVSATFNDPIFKKPSENWYLSSIQADKLWRSSTGSNNVIIAVIDNGFDLNHEELVNQYIKPYNVVTKTKNVNFNSKNHGTHVSSTIIANENNGKGIVGICPNCKLMPIKIADDNDFMSTSYIIDGILYAIKNDADVVNLSLGKEIKMNNHDIIAQHLFIKTMFKDEEQLWDQLFAYASENNTICVIAAGNSNLLCGLDAMQRSKNTIKVGSHNQFFQISNFSNFGKYVDIYAPGEQIYGASPNQKYEFLQGTSMAAPIVSGVIGILKSKNKNISLKEIQNYFSVNQIQINGINRLKIK
jgi:subtilisin family serine protease